jgi:hypothetical protein
MIIGMFEKDCWSLNSTRWIVDQRACKKYKRGRKDTKR